MLHMDLVNITDPDIWGTIAAIVQPTFAAVALCLVVAGMRDPARRPMPFAVVSGVAAIVGVWTAVIDDDALAYVFLRVLALTFSATVLSAAVLLERRRQ